MKYQRERDDNVNPVVIDAAWNHHIHTFSCFPCSEQKSSDSSTKHQRGKDHNSECHYRFPACMKHKTTIVDTSTETVQWYGWDGSKTERHINEINPK